MEILPLKTSVLKQKFDVEDAFTRALQKNKLKLRSGDIVVVSSKIVALAQGHIVDLRKNGGLAKLVAHEADVVFPGGPMPLALKNGILIPQAGIDLSNVPKNYAILWPKNPQDVARSLWKNFRRALRIKNCGVIIADSHCQPLRWGTTGLALAWAGFEGVQDVRGTKDIYGKKLRVTRKAVADNLASGALVVMGEADEKIPFVVVRGAPVKFTSRQQKSNEIFVKPSECIFKGIYNKKFVVQFNRNH